MVGSCLVSSKGNVGTNKSCNKNKNKRQSEGRSSKSRGFFSSLTLKANRTQPSHTNSPQVAKFFYKRVYKSNNTTCFFQGWNFAPHNKAKFCHFIYDPLLTSSSGSSSVSGQITYLTPAIQPKFDGEDEQPRGEKEH
jgi:hypothetical protein